METEGKQTQQERIEHLLLDLERQIASGAKAFIHEEVELEQNSMPQAWNTKNRPADIGSKGEKKTYFYLVDEIGSSDCIYRNRPLSDYYDAPENGAPQSPETARTFHLVAIRTQERYYICKPEAFAIDKTEPLPSWVELFSDTVQRYNDYLQKTAFPPFYQKLKPYEMKPSGAVVYKARRAVLEREPLAKTWGLHTKLPNDTLAFSELEVMRFVCNNILPADAAVDKLSDESVMNEYRTLKSENFMFQKLMEEPDLVSEEEWKLWDAVASQPNDARTLTVTFHFRGQTEDLQIKPETIREVILNKVSFKPADIAPASRSLFYSMGAAPWSDGEKSTLTWEHISKITYWGAVLYQKEETMPETPDVSRTEKIDQKAAGLKAYRKEKLSELREKNYENYLKEIYEISGRLAIAEDERADHETCEKLLTEAQYIDVMAQCKAFQSILDELPPGVSKAALLYMGRVNNWAEYLPEKEAEFYKAQTSRTKPAQSENRITNRRSSLPRR